MKKNKRGEVSRQETQLHRPSMNVSGKNVTVLEFAGHIVVTNVPNKIALKDTISDCIAELIDDNVETRFGGVSLPTTIKDLNEVITNLGNFVAMKTNDGDFILFVEVNRSVCRLPILVVVDCGNHLCFDLTHERRVERVWSVVGCCPLHSYKIHDFGGLCAFSGHLADWHTICYKESPPYDTLDLHELRH